MQSYSLSGLITVTLTVVSDHLAGMDTTAAGVVLMVGVLLVDQGMEIIGRITVETGAIDPLLVIEALEEIAVTKYGTERMAVGMIGKQLKILS